MTQKESSCWWQRTFIKITTFNEYVANTFVLIKIDLFTCVNKRQLHIKLNYSLKYFSSRNDLYILKSCAFNSI